MASTCKARILKNSIRKALHIKYTQATDFSTKKKCQAMNSET
jgi:hypothetical protein